MKNANPVSQSTLGEMLGLGLGLGLTGHCGGMLGLTGHWVGDAQPHWALGGQLQIKSELAIVLPHQTGNILQVQM